MGFQHFCHGIIRKPFRIFEFDAILLKGRAFSSKIFVTENIKNTSLCDHLNNYTA
jgi:hypothetical protein